jgi:hypothetical protein
MSDCRVIYEDDGENIYLSTSTSATAHAISTDDDGTAGVREPRTPTDDPPELAAEAVPDSV